MIHDALGDRMKEYENVSRNYLTRRVPVVVRVDGKAFHTLTRGLNKPFDLLLMRTMQETMRELCREIQGCMFGYTQSDEITLILTDYRTIQTDAWFGYNIQKMASVSASIATREFNRLFREKFEAYCDSTAERVLDNDGVLQFPAEIECRMSTLLSKLDKACFDSRCFSVPKEEVVNCLIWRQQDATRNSIESVGHAHFSQSELHGKNCDEIQDMLMTRKGINWNDFPADCKRGAACYRVKRQVEMEDPRNPGKQITVERNEWTIDRDIPIFTQEREFIERFL